MTLLVALEVIVGVVVTSCTSFMLYWVYLRKYGYWVDKNISSTKPFPILGDMVAIFKGMSFLEIDMDICKKHGKLFGGYTGTKPVMYLRDPEFVKLILVKDFATFSSKRPFVTGDTRVDLSLPLVKGDEKWRNLRNTITPSFSSGKLRNMIPIIADCATISTSNFEKYATNNEYVNVKKLYGNYTLDVISNVAFGTRLDSHKDPNNEFVCNARKIFKIEITLKTFIVVAFPKLAKLLNYSFFPKDALEFFKDVTNNIIERRLKTNEVRHDFLQLMMDSMKAEDKDNVEQKTPIQKVEQIKRIPLTKDEVLSNCVMFFVAGYDTTATTLTMASYYLACNPDKQKKVLEEVDRIWENRTTLDAEAVYEAKYLDAVIDETLRISPPFLKIERMTAKDYELGDTGVTIPKGMVVAIPVFVMHHDPDFYPNPEEFRPERFLPKENNEVIPYTYLPFAAGPRNCVALRLALLEIKMCLLHVLRHLEFTTCPQTKIPVEYMKRTALLQPKDVILSVHKRN